MLWVSGSAPSVRIARRREGLADRFRVATISIRSLLGAVVASPAQLDGAQTSDARPARARELADQIALLSIQMADEKASEPERAACPR